MVHDLLLEPIVRRALEEDFGRAGDVTASLLGKDKTFRAAFVARQAGVVSGLGAARIAMRLVDPMIRFTAAAQDGDAAAARAVLATVEGPAAAILAAERVALNFLTLMSGVATLTQTYVRAVAGVGAGAQIAATRKTLPGLRVVQKAAVIHGGGLPHRYGLDDAVLIKDNHIAACGGLAEALRGARAAAGHMRVIEVEVDRLAQLEEALPFAPHAILLDNFSLADLAAAAQLAKGRAILEASGGVTLASVRAIAETGVDVISVGALTHSAPALDIGLDAA
jgi:nicotinate-nucleotide pyrophosphorylase (carboxylating)